jgi:hypothetical protein
MLKKVYLLIIIVFWPLLLYLANIPGDSIFYILPSLFLVVAYFTRKDLPFISNLAVLLIAVISPKLALFPLCYFLISLIFEKRRLFLIFLILSVGTLFYQRFAFIGQTVFQPDYEGQQQILRDTKLYDSIFIARMFHNKARIPLEKIAHNFFALTDPNNYFFAFHPREGRDNQNLQKFPFLSIIFFLYGLYLIKKSAHIRFILISFIAGILSLSALTNFDRNDFILWFPLSLIILHGISETKLKPKYETILLIISIVFACIELIRIFVSP